MKPKERVRAALSMKETDRPPMQVSFTPEFARRLAEDLGIDISSHNPHGGGNTYVLEQALGEDMLLTSVGWVNSYSHAGTEYTDEWGVHWIAAPYTTPFGEGFYMEIDGHPLAEDGAVESYVPPDPERPELYEEAERVIREFGEDYWITGVAVCTIWETAWALRGLGRMLMDLVENPDLAERILDIPYQYHTVTALRLAEMGVDMIWTGDDMGEQNRMMISPRLWRKYFKPRMAELFRRIKEVNPEIKIAYHSDGNIEPIIPDLIDIGLDVLNPVQPRSMDPAKLKRLYGDRLCFWGGIDEQYTLPFGAPAEVRAEVEERIRTLGAGGGYIAGPTHHVQLDTPMENFWAMVRAIEGR